MRRGDVSAANRQLQQLEPRGKRALPQQVEKQLLQLRARLLGSREGTVGHSRGVAIAGSGACGPPPLSNLDSLVWKRISAPSTAFMCADSRAASHLLQVLSHNEGEIEKR